MNRGMKSNDLRGAFTKLHITLLQCLTHGHFLIFKLNTLTPFNQALALHHTLGSSVINHNVIVRGRWRHVIPGSVLSPWCGLRPLRPLCSAWSCCNTSHSRAASGSESPPAQSQTPVAGGKRQKTTVSRTLLCNKMTSTTETGITTRTTKIMTDWDYTPRKQPLPYIWMHTCHHKAQLTNIPCNYARGHSAYGLHIVSRAHTVLVHLAFGQMWVITSSSSLADIISTMLSKNPQRLFGSRWKKKHCASELFYLCNANLPHPAVSSVCIYLCVRVCVC